MKKAAYRAGRIQVQGTLKINVFSHVKYREALARKRFWAVLWRLAKFLRLLAQPLCWNDKTRSFRNASSRSEIHFFLQKVRSSVRMPLANSFSHLYSKSAFLLSQGEIRILSCSLTPRKIIPLVVIATLLKRQKAIIPQRLFQERDPYFFAKSAIKRQDVARKLLSASLLEICVFAQPGWNPNYFFAQVRKSGVHQTPTLL